MDVEFKAKWLAALRSGEFEQCRDELTDGFGYCCIGVGYQVAGEDCGEIVNEDDPTDIASSALGIPKQLRDELIKLNDGTAQEPGKTFAEIADYIEVSL